MSVMSSRSLDADDLDFFPTPPWATRAMIQEVIGKEVTPVSHLKSQICWENACGQGHMALPLSEFFGRVYCSDIFDHGMDRLDEGYGPFEEFEHSLIDFTDANAGLPACGVPHWIISNPPFSDRVIEFVLRAIEVAPQIGFAYLLRLPFVETESRYREIFSRFKPSIIAYSADRIPMIEGVYDPEASSATAYAWFIWLAADCFNGDAKGVWIPYGSPRRFTKSIDMNLAMPGEAALRKAKRKAEAEDVA